MTITFKITKAGQPVATRTLKPPLTADEATVVLQRLDDSWIGGLCAEGKQDDFLPPREKLADGATYELHLQEQSGGQIGAHACMDSADKATPYRIVNGRLLDVMRGVPHTNIACTGHGHAKGLAERGAVRGKRLPRLT